MMSRAMHGNVVILADALPGAEIRRRAVAEHAGADRGRREVVVALDGDQVRLRSIRYDRAVDGGLHDQSLLIVARFSCVNSMPLARLPAPAPSSPRCAWSGGRPDDCQGAVGVPR